MWVDKGSEFNNRSMKSWLPKSHIESYSIHNEEKPENINNIHIHKLNQISEKKTKIHIIIQPK